MRAWPRDIPLPARGGAVPPPPPRPASREDLDEGTISIGVPSFIPIEKKLPEEKGPDEGASTNSDGEQQVVPQRRPDKLYFMLLQVWCAAAVWGPEGGGPGAVLAGALSTSAGAENVATDWRLLVVEEACAVEEGAGQSPGAVLATGRGAGAAFGARGSAPPGTFCSDDPGVDSWDRRY